MHRRMLGVDKHLVSAAQIVAGGGLSSLDILVVQMIQLFSKLRALKTKSIASQILTCINIMVIVYVVYDIYNHYNPRGTMKAQEVAEIREKLLNIGIKRVRQIMKPDDKMICLLTSYRRINSENDRFGMARRLESMYPADNGENYWILIIVNDHDELRYDYFRRVDLNLNSRADDLCYLPADIVETAIDQRPETLKNLVTFSKEN